MFELLFSLCKYFPKIKYILTCFVLPSSVPSPGKLLFIPIFRGKNALLALLPYLGANMHR